MPLIRLLCLLLVAVCATWFAVATHAQQDAPLFPAPSADSAPAQAAAPAQASAPGGLFHEVGRFVVQAERDFSRELNSHMAAIRRGEGGAALIGGILAAFLYGVFHTLAVGHGKTVVVGYFLGHAARPVHGLAMAGWIALSHVLGAVVVAFLAHWLLRQMTMSPIEQNHWIRIVSFGAIALIGAWMLMGEVRRLRGQGTGHTCAQDHGHGHDHHGHDHGGGKRRLLAVAAGFVPCTGAILILTFAFANGILLSGLLMVGGIHDVHVPQERARQLYTDHGATNKVFIDLGCSSHNAMWEKNHMILFKASLEWLTEGSVNGQKTGMLKLGY